MAASKQKKRLINSTNSEQYRPGKKTKLDSSNCLVSLKPHIGLKWDQYLSRVVPKKEQVGILWSDLSPFIESQKHRSGLADVTYVPPETFSLDSLRDVISYEVWATCLTEAERKFLIQFLPSGTDAEESVQSLLTGNNHHFGNPFLSWSSSLCCGDIHPDAVLNKEKHIKKNEKAYRIYLSNYHSNTVETLKKWRKRWLSCTDTENLFRDNLANQKQGLLQLKATKSGMPLKVTPSVDVSKFMSYIKISRTQLNHIKRLKQSGDGIQTKHVSRVIGGLDKSNVKPYGALLEDEQRRLHEHWLNMSRNDLPAAFEVLKDRKAQVEKSMKLLGLKLAEKNVSVLKKVERSPQNMLQGGDDQSTSLRDPDDEETYMEKSMHHSASLNAKDHHDLIVAKGPGLTCQREQSSIEQDQDSKDVSCVDKDISCYANNPDKQSENLMAISCNDGLGVQNEDIRECSYEDTTHKNDNAESQQINSINFTSTLVNTLDSENMQVEDPDGVSYTCPSVNADEQDQDVERISHSIVNNSCGHSANISSEMIHPKTSTVIVEQEEIEHNTMIHPTSSKLIPKSSGEQVHVDDFLDLSDQIPKGEKDRWVMAGSLQSNYHPPENIMCNDSGGLEIRQRYLSSGQHSSSIYLDNGISSQPQAKIATSAFPVDNPASVIEPFSNQQSNGQLQSANDIGLISYPLQHANSIEQSTGLHSLANNRLAQSAPYPRPLQEQQFIDQSDDGLYSQLHRDYYSDVSFPTKVNPPISEQDSYADFASMDHRYNWLPEGCQSHSNNNNNLSGLGSDNFLTPALPSGSNTDGTLLSAISQYKQPAVHMGHSEPSPSQLPGTRNQVAPPQHFLPRTLDTNTPLSHIYGYTQNLVSSGSSHMVPAGTLDNMQWTNFIQQNPGMPPDFKSRQFRGPWTR